MPWQLLSVRVDSATTARAEALLRLAGAEAVSLGSDDGRQILEPPPESMPLWESVKVEALFPAEADLRPLASLLVDLLALPSPPVVLTLEDAAWRDARGPLGRRRIGTRLLLLGAGEPSEQTARAVVRLAGGMAFGTGEHPTTLLCLEWLDAQLSRGARVVDYGCGSGILAIAALALGAEAAWAVDVEPQALSATRQNARLNGLDDGLWVGRPEQLPDIEADVLLANILARPLMNLVGVFGHHLRDGGDLIMSGVLEDQCDGVEAAFAPTGFGSFDRASRDGWCRLTAVRDAAAALNQTE